VYDLPTTPGHAPDEVADGLLRDLLLLVNQCCFLSGQFDFTEV
jgi:hypothetical protein